SACWVAMNAPRSAASAYGVVIASTHGNVPAPTVSAINHAWSTVSSTALGLADIYVVDPPARWRNTISPASNAVDGASRPIWRLRLSRGPASRWCCSHGCPPSHDRTAPTAPWPDSTALATPDNSSRCHPATPPATQP